MGVFYVTEKEDEQGQDANPSQSRQVKGGKLFDLRQMQSGKTAARSMWQLRVCQSENNA